MSIYNQCIEENPHHFYSKTRKGQWHFSIPVIYRYLAIYIRVQALQNKPTESDTKIYPQDDNFKEAINYFRDNDFPISPPGLNLVKLLFAKFYISPTQEKIISQNYQSIVGLLGQWVAGDEKLFHFTGESSWLRMCPNKDDYIGLWFYMLCGRLATGKSFLLYTKSHTCETVLGGTIYCSQIVSDWGDIVKKYTTNGKTVLIADSYYLDQTGYEILMEKKVPFVCAVQECRFTELAMEAKKKSKHEGDTALLYNDTNNTMFITHWYEEKKLGRKFVITNAFKRKPGNTRKAIIPGCDDFSLTFNTCDHFNRDMHDKTWPHKSSSLSISEIDEKNLTFQQFGLELANQLYKYACSM